MIITTIIYTGIETILGLIEYAIKWLAMKILNNSITCFVTQVSEDEVEAVDIFQKFINLIPFSSNIQLGSIIKGISYGLIFLLLIITVLKSISSPFTGDDAPNPFQAIIRAALTIVLELAIFGAKMGGTGSRVRYTGFLSLIGKWFGTILAALGNIATKNEISIKLNYDPRTVLACCILEVTIMTQIFSAALQYVERIISFAIYIILSPIAVAMYASPETESTAKDWFIGLLTQFLSIFVSLLMWIAFLQISTKDGNLTYTTLLDYAVMVSVLGLMKNSEKILNVFGFRTMRLGDTAHSVVSGAALFMSTTSSAVNSYNQRYAEKNGKARSSMLDRGNASPFSANGEFGNKADMFVKQDFSTFGTGMFGMPSVTSIKNAVSQNRDMTKLKNAISNGDAIDAKTFNSAYGLSANSNIRAIGNGEKSVMQPATVMTSEGREVKGYIGDAAINRGGQTKLEKDVFFPTSDHPNGIDAGSQINFGDNYSGKQFFISDNAIATDNQNHFAYFTSSEKQNIDFSEMKNFNEINNNNPKEIQRTVEHPARNV